MDSLYLRRFPKSSPGNVEDIVLHTNLDLNVHSRDPHLEFRFAYSKWECTSRCSVNWIRNHVLLILIRSRSSVKRGSLRCTVHTSTSSTVTISNLLSQNAIPFVESASRASIISRVARQELSWSVSSTWTLAFHTIRYSPLLEGSLIVDLIWGVPTVHWLAAKPSSNWGS